MGDENNLIVGMINEGLDEGLDEGLEDLDEGLEDLDVSCTQLPDSNSTGPKSPVHVLNGGNLCPVQYTSPMKTVETVETVVSTNKVTVTSVIEPPREGMVFKGWKEIEYYYKAYAEQQGFGVSRYQAAYNDGKEGIQRQRRAMTWKCECWGAPNMRAQREARKRAKVMDIAGTGGNVNGVIAGVDREQAKRKSKKCECPAQIYASVRSDGNWVLKKVVLIHAHKVSPSKSKLVKEYRMKNLTTKVRKRLLNYFDEGVPVSQIRSCLATENENLPNVKDMQHEVYKERRLKMEGGDAKAMMSYFEYMQADNQNFYHAHRLDDEGRLKDVMWVDARSRVAYQEFGDVVCFDATYLTNEYELPFCNFVGVNHHGQSILLGCALVSHEDCDTFRWVFHQWLACMGSKAPIGILTDQAAAMRKPLAEVMPNTRHRWCIWHILKKLPEKLGKCSLYEEFKNPLKAVIYESFTPVEFESRWSALLKEYKLESNDWLQDLYKEREMWVPAYMKEYFWAGMKTTQRVESINSFFDGFINRHTKLFEFPKKYCKALRKRVGDETSADERDGKFVRRLLSGFKIEKIFQKVYTDAKFQEVQKECERMLYVIPKQEIVVSDHEIQYVLEDRVWIVPNGKSEEEISDYRRFYSVTFNPVNKDVSCDCRKFEKDGILCKHCIRVWDLNHVSEAPEKYVLGRWRKDIVRRHTRVKVPYHDPTQSVDVKRYNKLMPELEALCEEASVVDDKTLEVVRKAVSNLRLDVKERHRKYAAENAPALMPSIQFPNSEAGSTTPTTVSGCTPGSVAKPVALSQAEVVIQDPKVRKRPRGRPKGSRNKSLAEIGYKSSKGTQKKDDPAHPAKIPVVRNASCTQVPEIDCNDDMLLNNSLDSATFSEIF